MLFENNDFIDYKNYDNYDNYNIDLNLFGLVRPTESNNMLFDLKTGFQKGNMFKNSYDYYKDNMVQTLVPKTAKDRLLLKIYELDFAITDLSLYLYVHKDDEKIYQKFKEYTEEYNKVVSEYERQYGPLNLNDSNYSTFEWVKNPWPWDRSGGNLNV